MGVEGGQLQVVTLNDDGRGEVVADHTQPVHLLFGELFARAGVALQDPVLEVPPHAVGVPGQRVIKTADTANEGDQRGQFVGRVFALVIVEMGVSEPDGQRGARRGRSCFSFASKVLIMA